MATAKRRRNDSLHLELPNGQPEELPSIAAAFLILFDVKAGLTDTSYFVHDDDYAGISAFINEPAEESNRNALMLAVGALVPLSAGKLGIPSTISDLLPLEPLPTRLRPLFTVGVHDMQTLSEGSRNQAPHSALPDNGMGYGWVGNTTDDILALKPHLYDTLISIPPSYTKQAKEKVWPRLESKPGLNIKATQRDLRRYHTLRRELRRFDTSISSHDSRQSVTAPDLPFENTQETYDDASSTLDTQLAEPQSWSALAYNSFMWWASAGEKRTDLDEEEEYDAALLQHFDANRSQDSPSRPRSARKSPGRSPGMDAMDIHQPAALEMRIVAYFHRLTTLILKTISDIVDASDYGDDDEEADANGTGERQPLKPSDVEEDETVLISSEDMSRMGLDIWSDSDREFVKELISFYWGRKADVRGGRVECCGVRIC
ncbi:hypothetical protein P7C71_g1442, partial [Lecanoromycetidae sp. Uapishka_2]